MIKIKTLNKKSQAEYAWLFSIIVGAMILFLAIFFAGKLFKTGTFLTETEILRNFDIILNPFSSVGSIASLTLSRPVEMPVKTEMKFECSSSITNEGEKISLREIDKTRGEWTSYTIKNKYIFANTTIAGKRFWTFSKPFELPWRVDDLIYVISENYCFVTPSAEMGKELSMINASTITVASDRNGCDNNSKKVCFPGDLSICDVSVTGNTVTKKGQPSLSYVGDALMYAAIFSDKTVYGCNIQRLVKRLATQTEIFSGQAQILKMQGCDTSNLINALEAFKTALASTQVISDLASFAAQAKNADSYNCPIIKR